MPTKPTRPATAGNPGDGASPGASVPLVEVARISDILFHEDVDLERVASLIERLSADGALRNPPIVATVAGKRRRMLLDGANRVEALSRMGIRHLVVQTERLDDPALRLAHWNHVVRAREAEALVKNPGDGIRALPSDGSGGLGRDRTLLCRLRRPDGGIVDFRAEGTPVERAGRLRDLVKRCTHPRARLDRVAHDDLEAVRRAHPEFGGLVIYPDRDKADVLALAANGARLPSGVTRFLLPRRVLGFHVRLSFLEADLPLAEKRRRLDGLLAGRFATGRVRYYEEPVFVFDD